MEKRLRVVLDAQRDGIKASARAWGYPRNTVRRWVRRYNAHGEAGLRDRRLREEGRANSETLFGNKVRFWPYHAEGKSPIAIHHWVRNLSWTYSDMHYEAELGIVMRGRVERTVSSYRWELRRGEMWINSIWEPHAEKILEGPCELLVLHILPQTLVGTTLLGCEGVDWYAPFSLPPSERPVVPPERREEVLRIAGALAETPGIGGPSSRPAPPHRAQVHVEVLRLLCFLMESCGWRKKAAGAYAQDHATVEKALELAFQQKTKATVVDGAKACGMSIFSFQRLFRRTMGMGFGEFASSYRVAAVAERLAASDDSVKMIAIEWGFTDSSHLDRAFRGRYGCSPTEYRNRAAGGNG